MKPVVLFFVFGAAVASLLPAQTKPRLEDLTGKTILIFTPHPDDETFCCAGTLALLAKNNTIRIVIYTNDDKGSYDTEMTSERLARIRMHEEEEACRVLGKKFDAAVAHVSQFEPSINKYRPDWSAADLEKTKAGLRNHIHKKDGHY